MVSPRKRRVPVAALAISIAAVVVTVIVIGLVVSLQSEQADEVSAGARQAPIPSNVYDPVYVARDEVDWPSDSLVLGVAGTETSKAYPITHLNQREMVIDSLDGTPIVASW